MKMAKFVESLERLSHSQRVQQMMALGNQPNAAAIVAEMAQGSPYQRHLAVYSIRSSKDLALLSTLLHDDSKIVRSTALKLAVKVLPDAQLSQLLDTLSEQMQLNLVRLLHKAKRFAVIDAWLLGLEPLKQLRYLAFASPAAPAQLDPALFERANSVDWGRLATFQPAFALEWFERYLAEHTMFEPRFIVSLNRALLQFSKYHPEFALTLLQAATKRLSAAKINFQCVLERFPDRVAELLFEQSEELLDLSDYAHLLSPELLEKSLVYKWVTVRTSWFRRISPERRADLFERHQLTWRNSYGYIHEEIVALLPAQQREAEARRTIALPSLQGDFDNKFLAYVPFLPWDEALASVQDLLGIPDQVQRGAALAALIGVARYTGRHTDVLALVDKRSKEPDPVRGAMLEALGNLPPSIWKDEDLPGFERIFRAALKATDCSMQTVLHIERLVLRIHPFHPEWAAQQLVALIDERKQLLHYQLWPFLNGAQVAQIDALVKPILSTWIKQGAPHQVTTLVHKFQHRLEHAPNMLALLEQIALDKEIHSAEQAVRILGQEKAGYITALAPKLVKQDPSWIYVDVISLNLESRNPQLLCDTLAKSKIKGKFSTGKDLPWITLRNLFVLWSEKQQQVMEQYLDRLLARVEHDSYVQTEVIYTYADLYALPPRTLLKLAQPARKADEPVRDSIHRDLALYALAHLDSSQGVPVLIEALSDERAHTAIYALRSQLLQLDKRQALEYLKAAPLKKVSVAKEVVRLIGELGNDEAYAELLRLNTPDLHRDVRWALNRALWKYLDREQTWQILQQSMDSQDAVLVGSVLSFDLSQASAEQKQRYRQFFEQGLQHGEVKTRILALNTLQQFALNHDFAQLYPLIVAEASSPYQLVREAALELIFSNNNRNPDVLIKQAIEAVLPDWKLTHHLLRTLTSNVSYVREYAAVALPYVANQPLHARNYATLASFTFDGSILEQVVEHLHEQNLLHTDVMQCLIQYISYSYWRPITGEQQLFEQWFAHSDERVRRLAFALWNLFAARQGWTEELQAIHQQFCQDPAPLVASAALDTFPPDQDDEEDDE